MVERTGFTLGRGAGLSVEFKEGRSARGEVSWAHWIDEEEGRLSSSVRVEIVSLTADKADWAMPLAVDAALGQPSSNSSVRISGP